MLNDLQIPGLLDTSSHDLIRQFFVPLQSESTQYDRGVDDGD
jgi:hypothetical protein